MLSATRRTNNRATDLIMGYFMKKHFLLSKILFALMISLVANIAYAELPIRSAKITFLRFYAVNHPVPSVAGAGVLQVNVTLTSPCAGLYVASSDDIIKAALHRAKASGSTISFYYDPIATSSWDPGYCRLNSLEVD